MIRPMTDWQSDSTLPLQAREGLKILCEGFQAALGEDLLSVVLFGSVAKGDEYYVPTTDVETLVVVKAISATQLDAMGPVLREARRKSLVTTMIVTPDDLASSCDVFPVKFCDAKEHHRLLLGHDHLADLEIHEDHMRLRCEQELRNLTLRLRAMWAKTAGSSKARLEVLARAGATFVDQLRTLMRLREGSAPLKRAEVVDKAESLGMDKALLQELLAIGRGRYSPKGEELTKLGDRFLEAAAKAAKMADTHEVK
jgi:hypothetical protein